MSTKTVVIRLLPSKLGLDYLDGEEIRPLTSFSEAGWSYYSDASEYVQEVMQEEIDKGVKRFLVDLTGGSFVISTDMGAFVTWFVLARDSGAKMVFACNEKVRGRLNITGLLALLGDHLSVEEATTALG